MGHRRAPQETSAASIDYGIIRPKISHEMATAAYELLCLPARMV